MNDEKHKCPECGSTDTALGTDWLYCDDCDTVNHTYKPLEPPQSPPENQVIGIDPSVFDIEAVIPDDFATDETKIAPKHSPSVFDDITNVVKLLDSDNTFTLYMPNADVQLVDIKPDKLYHVTITEVVGGDE